MRETEDDLRAEREILTDLAIRWRCNWRKLGNGGKYRIDAVLEREREIMMWVEVKDYSHDRFVGMNIPKYMEGCQLAALTGHPFYQIIRVDGRLGIVRIHDGLTSMAPPKYMIAGGTPVGREPLPDDIEPMAMFDKSLIRWLG